MSSGTPDHAHPDPVLIHPPRSYTAENPQHNTQMSGIAHSQSSGPVAGGTGGQIVTTTSAEKHKNGGAVKKQSLDYVLRSGLAGGLAGCAVSARNVEVTN